MKKIWVSVIVLLILLVVIVVSGCDGNSALSSESANVNVNLIGQQQGIWVNGQGKVMATPDIATLRLGIEAQTTTVAQAQSQAADAMDKVMDSLTGNGISEKDIQTQRFSIQRVTRWDSQKQEEIILGYRVTNIVTSKIRELDEVGTIIDDVAIAGGDLTRVDSIGFSVEDPSNYQEEARAKAMADAKIKAEKMADLAGVDLGKPTYITESSYIPSPIYPREFAEEAIPAAPQVTTSISPGELEVSVSVQVAYRIVD
jgi:uncharacterized protein YggE